MSEKPKKKSGPTPAQKSCFKKAIMGDIFGTNSSGSMLGMMYHSRTKLGELNYSKGEASSDKIEVKEKTEIKETLDASFSSGSENDEPEMLNPRQQLAVTINNWSTHPENDAKLIKEGGVHALIALAGFDDSGLKKCVANALYNLSSRTENRVELLNIGGATGVVSVTMNARTWKIARLCGMTLCNLSMAGNGGEVIMTKAGAVIALVVLMGIKQHRLLPLCVQALYNLTCVSHHFPGMERIMKALLTLPVVTGIGYDPIPLQVKALVNCSRFSWMRDRILEDGALSAFSSYVGTLAARDGESRTELVYNVITCMRALSETKQLLTELISKGTVELLQQLLPYCDDISHMLVIKTLHNLLAHIHSFPIAIYAAAVNIVSDLAHLSENHVTLQYSSSCFYLFTEDNLRNDPRLILRVIRALPKLLLSNDSVTQYFGVACAGNLFFNTMCDDTKQLEILVLKFVEAGPAITDDAAVMALTIAFAKLSEEPVYMDILVEHDKLQTIIELLLRIVNDSKSRSNYIIQESCCVAICRFSLQLDEQTANLFKKAIPELMMRLLSITKDHESTNSSFRRVCNDHGVWVTVPNGKNNISEKEKAVNVLAACVGSIRALAENGVYYNELRLLDRFFLQLADIGEKYEHDCLIPSLCCSIMTIYSFDPVSHVDLADNKVLHVLFIMTRSEIIAVRELVATVFCNISTHPAARLVMIRAGIVDIVTALSGATNEKLQELCARCICNLTVAVDQHVTLIKDGILHTLMMIALVRSVSNVSKQIAAHAMLNMLRDESLLAKVLDVGVIGALASLSAVKCSRLRNICAKGFLRISCSDKGRIALCQRRNVLQALFSLLKTGKQSKMIILVGTTVCNILFGDSTRKLAVDAGALSVLKVIATTEFEELRESTARVIMILVDDKWLQSRLIKEPVVSILVYVLEDAQDSSWSLECAVKAFSCFAKQAVFRSTLIEKGCISAFVGAIINGRVTTITVAEEICRCLCLLSYENTLTSVMLSNHILVALYCIYKGKLCDGACGNMMAITLRNLSGTITHKPLDKDGKPEETVHKSTFEIISEPATQCEVLACKSIMQQEGFRVLSWVLRDFQQDNLQLYRSTVMTLHNLCKVPDLHDTLIAQGFMEVIHTIVVAAGHLLPFDESSDVSDCGESTFTTASVTPVERSRAVSILPPSDANKLHKFDVFHLTTAVHLISQTPSCKAAIVKGKVVQILASISENISEISRYEIVSALTHLSIDKSCGRTLVQQGAVDLLIKLSKDAETLETQQQCSSGLSNLSEHACVGGGNVSSLLLLSLRLDGNTASIEGQNNDHTNTTSSNSNKSKSAPITSVSGNTVVAMGLHSDSKSSPEATPLKAALIENLERTASNTTTHSSLLHAGGPLTGGEVRRDVKSDVVEPLDPSDCTISTDKMKLLKFKADIKKFADGRTMNSSVADGDASDDENDEDYEAGVGDFAAEVPIDATPLPSPVRVKESPARKPSYSDMKASLHAFSSADNLDFKAKAAHEYFYKILPYSINIEAGGMPKRSESDMPLPTLVGSTPGDGGGSTLLNRSEDMLDSGDDLLSAITTPAMVKPKQDTGAKHLLTNVELRQEALPKDETPVDLNRVVLVGTPSMDLDNTPELHVSNEPSVIKEKLSEDKRHYRRHKPSPKKRASKILQAAHLSNFSSQNGGGVVADKTSSSANSSPVPRPNSGSAKVSRSSSFLLSASANSSPGQKNSRGLPPITGANSPLMRENMKR